MSGKNTPDLSRKGSKQQYAYDYIKHAVMVNKYHPGDIITEFDICNQLPEISRTPIRDALKNLVFEGLLENVPGQGMRVAALHFEDILANLEFRIPVESSAAKLFTARATTADRAELKDSFHKQEKAFKAGNYEAAVNEDNRFHILIGIGSKNALFENSLTTLINQTSRSAFFTVSDPERMQLSISQHKEILDAIEANDSERAEKAVRDHLVSWSQYVIQLKFKNYIIV